MYVKGHPTKQVHLDFHTSPDILKIGGKFSKEQFQAALKKGKVESISVFAKCHHGMCYYPTKVGIKHPNLDFDLTGAMVNAAHEIGVKAPIYITAGWSETDAINHPEWRSKTEDGKDFMTLGLANSITKADTEKREGCAWHFLCLNDGEYAQHIYELTEEICKRYKEIDGLFFDICLVGMACYCHECQEGMKKMGLNPKVKADAEHYYTIKRKAFMKKCEDIMRKYHPNGTIFFNSGGADQYRPEYHENQTHFEMEDLPTAWGGYDKLPIRAKYFSRSDKSSIGMTGKFHLSWGEFGGFKSKEALRYEISTMAMYGVGCSIGDHMHPDGEMEMQTYENIGYAYDYLDTISPYCYNGKATARVGVWLSNDENSCEGVSNILLENQIDYEIIFDNDFEEFDTVIFPDKSVVDDDALDKINTYISKGGKVLFMADALVKNGAFQIDCGAEYIAPSEFDNDYIFTSQKYIEELPDAPMLCYSAGHKISLTDGEVLAELIPPYFNRTVGRFCGHLNTPHNKEAKPMPAIVQKGNVLYMAHSMPMQYMEFGSLYHKRYFMLALGRIFGGGAFKVSGLGSQGRCTMIKQEDKNRYCFNMVYAIPVKRGCAEIIEDIMPVYNIEIVLNVKEKITKAYNGVTGEELKLEKKDGKQMVVVPKLKCHASIVFEY